MVKDKKESQTEPKASGEKGKATKPKKAPKKRDPNSVRLHVKGIHLGYRRGRHSQNLGTSLIKIEGVNSSKDATFYYGKRLAYVYRCKSGTKAIWGRVAASHGNSGVVRARFRKNLPPKSIGKTLRVMLFPSNI